MSRSRAQEYDVVIIGAGLSGINTAYRLREAFPDLSFVMLEKRGVMGGTWEFWKYPGIRSDSSLAVFGLPWYPWPHDMDFAPADLIAEYIRDAAASQGLDKAILLRHDVTDYSWSSKEQRWTFRVGTPEGEIQIKAGWMFLCGGYYNYESPRVAQIPGLDKFRNGGYGQVLHPQFWDPDTDYSGKKVVVVGSGATAITLLPSLAEKAAHVTMLQRSPTYVMALPGRDNVTTRLRRWLGVRLASRIDWWRRMLVEVLFVQFLLRFPDAGRRMITAETKRRLPKDYPVDEHFNPRYNPFEQRLCFCPDGDFFDSLRRPNCEVVTAVIEDCDEKGIKLTGDKGGKDRIDADMIITATGLHLQLLGGVTPIVDGKPCPVGERYAWRSCMLDGIPNMCAVMGYTAGTWTPGADVHVRAGLKVMRHMRSVGATSVQPYISPEQRAAMPKLPALPNNSTYILEARSRLPKSAGCDPWQNCQNFFSDAWYLWFGGVTKGLRYNIPAARKGKSD